MIRTPFALAVLIAAADAYAAMSCSSTVCTDSFTTTSSVALATYDANYSVTAGAFTVNAADVVTASSNVTHSTALRNFTVGGGAGFGSAFSDVSVEFTMLGFPDAFSGQYYGGMVRANSAGTAGYACTVRGNATWLIERVTGGVFTTIASGSYTLPSSPFAPRKKFGCIAQDARISVEFDEMEIGFATDATYASGTHAGFFHRRNKADSNIDDLVVTKLDPSTVSVPNCEGGSESTCESALGGAGLVKGTVTVQCSDEPADEILSQTPPSGTQVLAGSAVNLAKSSGVSCGTPIAARLIPLLLFGR